MEVPPVCFSSVPFWPVSSNPWSYSWNNPWWNNLNHPWNSDLYLGTALDLIVPCTLESSILVPFQSWFLAYLVLCLLEFLCYLEPDGLVISFLFSWFLSFPAQPILNLQYWTLCKSPPSRVSDEFLIYAPLIYHSDE